MVDQANRNDASERVPPEFGTLRAVDELPSEDFVAAVEQRAALKGDVAGRKINWRLRRRLKRLAGAVIGLAVVAAIAGSAYLYREEGGDPLGDSVTAIGSAADSVGTWIEEQTADLSADGAGATGTSSDTVVSQADQEVLASNAGTSSQETTPEPVPETAAPDAADTDAGVAAVDHATAGDAGATETVEAGVSGAETVENQAADIVAVEPDVETVDTMTVETPDLTTQNEAQDVVDSSDNADVASTVENLAADEALESDIAATDAVQTVTVETAAETQASDAASTEAREVADVVVPTPETPPSSDETLADEGAPEASTAVAETTVDDAAVPPLPAENIADIDAALSDETITDEPVEVAEVTEPVVPVAELPIVSSYSHSGIRAELTDYGTAEQAQDGWRELKSELGGVVGDHSPVIEEGSAGAGLIYRVQIGYFDSAFAAANFCTAVMDRKVTCTVIPQ